MDRDNSDDGIIRKKQKHRRYGEDNCAEDPNK